ncbi:MAG: dephospho-CoA kinase [Bacillota bacterium]|nr:dephospho-CoA kinase [Bacillota bacterium]
MIVNKGDSMVIGITGGSGSGKSFVSRLFAENGFVIVDADKIAKDIMKSDESLKKDIKKFFGEEFVDKNGNVDRRALGEAVFADGDKLKLLNSLTHPRICKEIEKQIEEGGRRVIFDVPLLIGSDLTNLCDLVISVMADKDLRIKRIMQRDKVNLETAVNRVLSQLSDEEYIKGSDEQIYNNGNEDEVIKRVNELIKRYVE